MLCVEGLPPGQLIAALSPRGPHKDQQLLAQIITQVHRLTVQVGQHKIRMPITQVSTDKLLSVHVVIASCKRMLAKNLAVTAGLYAGQEPKRSKTSSSVATEGRSAGSWLR